ncbi:hypothetical protein, partial [Azospirillum sp. Sp 7]
TTSLKVGQTVAVSTLFSATDPDGDTIIGGQPMGTAHPQALDVGQTVDMSSLVSFSDPSSDPVVYYQFVDPNGGGTVNLNGAINRCDAADQAAGKIQVTPADFALLTYTGGASETLTVQAYDGMLWSDPTVVTIISTGAPSAMTAFTSAPTQWYGTQNSAFSL